MSRRKLEFAGVTSPDAASSQPARTLTPKQEAFARVYVETGNASEAYRRSYNCKPDISADTVKVEASKLMSNPNVALTIEGLRVSAAQRTEITVEKLSEMAMTAYRIASTAPTPQTSAMVKATEFLGKLHGLVIERKETGKPGEFSRMSDEDLERVIRGSQGDGGAGTVVTAPGTRVTH